MQEMKMKFVFESKETLSEKFEKRWYESLIESSFKVCT